MKRSFCAMLAVAVAIGLSLPTRADDKDSKAVLDKAIKALGGEAKLTKPQGFSWKIKGIISFGGNDNEFTSATTIQGIDRVHSQFEGEFNGNKFIGVTVLNGDKGWRNFGGMKMELDADALANEKRMIYLQVVPVTLVPLKGKGFKVETAGEEKVDDKPASILKVTGPDGKDFTLSFDRASGLPVKSLATVAGFGGMEFDQETTFADYKEFGGIKKATKTEAKRDGETFFKQEVTEFKALDKIDPKTFDEPE